MLIATASGPAAVAILGLAASAFGMDEIENHPVLQLMLFGAYFAISIIGATLANMVLSKQRRLVHSALGALLSFVFSLATVWIIFWLLGTSP